MHGQTHIKLLSSESYRTVTECYLCHCKLRNIIATGVRNLYGAYKIGIPVGLEV